MRAEFRSEAVHLPRVSAETRHGHVQALEKLDLDEATAAILMNNTVAEGLSSMSLGSRPKARLIEALRRLDGLVDKASGTAQLFPPFLQSRLSGAQREAILYNRILLMAAANKIDAARVAVAAFERQFPSSSRIPLLRVPLLLHDGKVPVKRPFHVELKLEYTALGL